MKTVTKWPLLNITILLKKRLRHGFFPVNFAKFLGTPFSIGHHRWLLLGCIAFGCIILATIELRNNNYDIEFRQRKQCLHKKSYIIC